MTDAVQSPIDRWLDAHWHGQATCPAGHGQWTVEPTMSFMPGFALTEQGPKIVHENGFTFVVLTCSTCGYVALLNSKSIKPQA